MNKKRFGHVKIGETFIKKLTFRTQYGKQYCFKVKNETLLKDVSFKYLVPKVFFQQELVEFPKISPQPICDVDKYYFGEYGNNITGFYSIRKTLETLNDEDLELWSPIITDFNSKIFTSKTKDGKTYLNILYEDPFFFRDIYYNHLHYTIDQWFLSTQYENYRVFLERIVGTIFYNFMVQFRYYRPQTIEDQMRISVNDKAKPRMNSISQLVYYNGISTKLDDDERLLYYNCCNKPTFFFDSHRTFQHNILKNHNNGRVSQIFGKIPPFKYEYHLKNMDVYEWRVGVEGDELEPIATSKKNVKTIIHRINRIYTRT